MVTLPHSSGGEAAVEAGVEVFLRAYSPVVRVMMIS
jgi:hypothetical protein